MDRGRTAQQYLSVLAEPGTSGRSVTLGVTEVVCRQAPKLSQ